MAGSLMDQAAAQANINLVALKQAVVDLDEQFGGSHGDIPEGPARELVGRFFGEPKLTNFALAYIRLLEKEHAATLTGDRKKERELSPEEWIKHRDAKAKAAAKAAVA